MNRCSLGDGSTTGEFTHKYAAERWSEKVGREPRVRASLSVRLSAVLKRPGIHDGITATNHRLFRCWPCEQVMTRLGTSAMLRKGGEPATGDRKSLRAFVQSYTSRRVSKFEFHRGCFERANRVSPRFSARCRFQLWYRRDGAVDVVRRLDHATLIM